MLKKFTSSVGGASIFIALVGLIAKGLGFFREIIFASIFGLSTEFDIFLVAAVFPITINIIVMTFGQNYLIPAYNKLKQTDILAGESFIKTNFLFFLFSGLLLAGILYLTSNNLISFFLKNTEPALKNTALDIHALLLITIPLTAGISVITAYQQALFEFRYSVISQLFPNLFVLLALFVLKDLNIYAIPVGYLAGTFIQFTFLIFKSKELLKLQSHSSFYKNLSKYISYNVIVIILIESIGQLYTISDRYFYDKLNPGGISSLNYALTLYLLPVSIISIALSTAIFPKFSLLFSKKENSNLERVFNDGMTISAVIFIPVMFIFIFYGDVIIAYLFQRGRFSHNDTAITSNVLFYYSLSIVLYSAYGILNKFIYSAGLINKLLWITVTGIIIKVGLNFYLVDKMQQNGLALSTTISFMFFFMSSLFVIYREKYFSDMSIFFDELIFNLINASISLIIAKQFAILLFTLHKELGEIIIFLVIFISNLFLLKSSSSVILINFFRNMKILR